MTSQISGWPSREEWARQRTQFTDRDRENINADVITDLSVYASEEEERAALRELRASLSTARQQAEEATTKVRWRMPGYVFGWQGISACWGEFNRLPASGRTSVCVVDNYWRAVRCIEAAIAAMEQATLPPPEVLGHRWLVHPSKALKVIAERYAKACDAAQADFLRRRRPTDDQAWGRETRRRSLMDSALSEPTAPRGRRP